MNRLIELIAAEQRRHETTINLIASENYPFAPVRDALKSWAGVKYAEGAPGSRYYAGCEIVDEIERTAEAEMLALFVPAELRSQYRVSLQPHSGTQANMIALFALLNPGDAILSMSLAMGGHISHGHAKSFAGSHYRIASYGVDATTEQLDYDALNTLAAEHAPALIIAGGSAYSRSIDFNAFGAIARQQYRSVIPPVSPHTNRPDTTHAFLLADIAHIAGLIAAGIHPSPFPAADIVTGTTHKTLAGPRGGFIIYRAELHDKIMRAQLPGMQGGPFMHAIAAKGIAASLARTPEYRAEQERVCATARALAEELSKDMRIISGGTDTHLFLIDTTQNGAQNSPVSTATDRLHATYSSLPPLTGLEAERRLALHGIIVNRNTIPFDPRSPRDPSGIRIGTPAMVRRGLSERDIPELASYIREALAQEGLNVTLKEKIERFARHFSLPLY